MEGGGVEREDGDELATASEPYMQIASDTKPKKSVVMTLLEQSGTEPDEPAVGITTQSCEPGPVPAADAGIPDMVARSNGSHREDTSATQSEAQDEGGGSRCVYILYRLSPTKHVLLDSF